MLEITFHFFFHLNIIPTVMSIRSKSIDITKILGLTFSIVIQVQTQDLLCV